MDEHDGLSVFSCPDDTEIDAKIESVREFIAKSCFEKFGITPVIKWESVSMAHLKSTHPAGLTAESRN